MGSLRNCQGQGLMRCLSFANGHLGDPKEEASNMEEHEEYGETEEKIAERMLVKEPRGLALGPEETVSPKRLVRLV
eukprot:symbB.v1.2.014289.t1/scaffold1034.1/size142864/2